MKEREKSRDPGIFSSMPEYMGPMAGYLRGRAGLIEPKQA
jgi:hypothetical protein